MKAETFTSQLPNKLQLEASLLCSCSKNVLNNVFFTGSLYVRLNVLVAPELMTQVLLANIAFFQQIGVKIHTLLLVPPVEKYVFFYPDLLTKAELLYIITSGVKVQLSCLCCVHGSFGTHCFSMLKETCKLLFKMFCVFFQKHKLNRISCQQLS